MDTYTLPSRDIALDEGYDVIVVGGGPSGCTAAAAAAREGARTLLVEQTHALGGMGTSGLVPAWAPFSDGQRIIYCGLAERVFRESKAGVPHVPDEQLDWVPLDPEQLKRVYDDLVTGAGADVLFGTFVTDAETDAGRVDAVIAAGKAGLTAYRARVFVDCTGDGDLSARAGAPFDQGEGDSGELQPVTHCFVLSNVDSYAFMSNLHRRDGNSPAARIAASDAYPAVKDAHFCHNLIGPDTMGFNSGHLWEVDNTDPKSVSRAMIDGRRLVKQFRDGLAEFAPETFGGAFIAATGSLMGVRETRRIRGDYVLTVEDWLARATFDDEICRNAYWIDIHTARGEIDKAGRDDRHVVNRYEHYKPGESHGIPYRCLTPEGLSNVLTAGRCISCDRPVQGSIRVMPACLATGEAAGIAAAFAAGADRPDVHAVDTDAVRARLRECGAYLP